MHQNLGGDIEHSFKSICVDLTKPDLKKKKAWFSGFICTLGRSFYNKNSTTEVHFLPLILNEQFADNFLSTFS